MKLNAYIDKAKPQNLYLVEFPDGFKVGVAVNLKSRLLIYTPPWCQPINNISVWLSPNAQYLETRIKREFRYAVQPPSTEYFAKHLLKTDLIGFICNIAGKPVTAVDLSYIYRQLELSSRKSTPNEKIPMPEKGDPWTEGSYPDPDDNENNR